MEQTESKPSRRLIWIGIAVFVVIAIIAIVTTVVLMNASQEESMTSSTATTEPAVETVATKEEVEENLDVLDQRITQAAEDQATAKAALKDGTNQVKIGD